MRVGGKLEEMREQKLLKFIDESEQQRDKLKTWQHSLEDNLLKLANQNKADAAILELQHKKKIRLWKQGLKQKIEKSIEQHEHQKEKLKTWQCDLEETLELNSQEIIDQNKRQKGENEGERHELENMLEQRIQQLTDQTEQQRKKQW